MAKINNEPCTMLTRTGLYARQKGVQTLQKATKGLDKVTYRCNKFERCQNIQEQLQFTAIKAILSRRGIMKE